MNSQESNPKNAPHFKYGKTANIRPGDIILVEELWMYSFHSRYHAKLCCNYCFADVSHPECDLHRKTIALKLCSACNIAHYCSPDCQRLDWKTRHKYECGIYKHFANNTKHYRNWWSNADVPVSHAESGECAQVVLALASKAVKALEKKKGKSDEEMRMLEAYKKMPAANDAVVYSHAKDKFLLNEVEPAVASRLLPALLNVCAGARLLFAHGPYGVGVCLEMARFGGHSCNPNAIALLGDDRRVRVVAIARIDSLDDVRLNRDPNQPHILSTVHGLRSGRFASTFGHECRCARCVAGDANDPVNVFQLRCPRSAECPGECKNFYYDIRLHTVRDFILPLETGVNSAAVRRGDAWVKGLTRKLTPCTTCGARYDVKLVAGDLAEVVQSCCTPILHMLDGNELDEQMRRTAALAKRYLHPACRSYKAIMYIKATSLAKKMKLVQHVKGMFPGTDVSYIIKSIVQGSMEIEEDFKMHLQEFSNAIADDVDIGNIVLDVGDVCYFTRHLMRTCHNFYANLTCCPRGPDPQIGGRMAVLCSQIGQKTFDIVQRMLTPGQYIKFVHEKDFREVKPF